MSPNIINITVIVVLFMALANLAQFIFSRIVCAVILDLCKMHFVEINSKNGVHNYWLINHGKKIRN